MKLQTITGEAWLLLLAALSGVIPQRDGSSVQSQVYRPVLEPTESVPPIGMYVLINQEGKMCIKVTVGVEYIVADTKRSWFCSLDPRRVKSSGSCEDQSARLLLTLPNSTGSLELTFTKEKKNFYVSKLKAHLSPQPVCEKCASETYEGQLSDKKLFITADGQSFKCQSETMLLTSSKLKIKLVPLQMQAFSLPRRDFGKEVECWADYNKRVIPIIIGAAAVGVFLIALLTFLFIKDRRRQDYQRL